MARTYTTRTYNLAQISFLIACGSALQLSESFIPFPIPIPGLKIGLANISTLLGLILFGIPAALEIAIFRPIVTSLTNGTFLSPGFVLSFYGSLASFGVMALSYYLSKGRKFFSVTAISIVGAVTHNVAEIVIAYYWLFKHMALFAIAPLFIIIAVIGGYFVGWSSKYVLEKIENAEEDYFLSFDSPEKNEPARELAFRDKVKILAAFIMVLSTIFFSRLAIYGVLIVLVLAFIVAYGETVSLISKRLFRLWTMVVGSLVLPVLFSYSGTVLWEWHFLRITDTGVHQGLLFSLRLVFLILISVWIGVTEPSKLSEELAWILSPLKYFHFSVNRIPRLTSLSLSFLPVVWERLARVKPKTLTNILDALAAFFIGLDQERYSAAEGGAPAARPDTDSPAPAE